MLARLALSVTLSFLPPLLIFTAVAFIFIFNSHLLYQIFSVFCLTYICNFLHFFCFHFYFYFYIIIIFRIFSAVLEQLKDGLPHHDQIRVIKMCEGVFHEKKLRSVLLSRKMTPEFDIVEAINRHLFQEKDGKDGNNMGNDDIKNGIYF